MVGGVGDAGTELRLVADTHETRCVGLHHDGLCSHDIGCYHAVVDVGIVSQTHEAPGGNSLWEGEFHRDITLAIGGKTRIEEGRGVEILTDIHILHV